MVRQPDATMQPTPQDDQLMSKHRVLGFKPHLRLEWRCQDGQSEAEQPNHHARLDDSSAASHSDEVFRYAQPPFHQLSAQRRQRLTLALRALDGHMDGACYRVIAEELFGRRRIPERAWKTHELRSRTIRLVQAGLALMRGGYRALLRPSSRKE